MICLIASESLLRRGRVAAYRDVGKDRDQEVAREGRE
jgi:hypothetical protein